MGVLLKAKQDGLIDEVKPLIDDLLKEGLFVSHDVVDLVLETAGEK